MKYALILAFLALIGATTAIQDYAVNRQGLHHGIEMHHSYSRVATNAHSGHEIPVQRLQTSPIPVGNAPATPEEINALEEPSTVAQENLLADMQPVGTECPPRATGVFPHLINCKQYLNCYKGKGSVQTCPPGTLFNPETKLCDNPTKVKCVTLSRTDNKYQREQQNAKVAQYNQFQSTRNTNQRSSAPDVEVQELPSYPQKTSQLTSRMGRTREQDYDEEEDTDLAADESVQNRNGAYEPSCPPDAIGRHLPHPFDCAKYLHCDITGTFIRDCGPGTHFNPEMEVCDWPQNVNCVLQEQGGSYKKPKELEIPSTVDYDDEMYSGIGRIDMRFSKDNEHLHNKGPAGAVFIPHNTRNQPNYWTTTQKPYTRFENGRPNYDQLPQESARAYPRVDEQVSRAHQAPIYTRPRPPAKVERRQFFTTTTTTTEKTPEIVTPKEAVMSMNNYNRAYYNQQKLKYNEEELPVTGDMSTLSDALKMLLKPYIKEAEVNISIPIETKMGNEQKDKSVNYEVSEEQQHLAGGQQWIDSSNENVEVELPTTTTTTTQRPQYHHQHNHPRGHFQHSPEWHANHGNNRHHTHHGPHQGTHNPEWHRRNGIPMPETRYNPREGPRQHTYNRNNYPTTTTTNTPDIPIPDEEAVKPTQPTIYFYRDPKAVIPLQRTTPKPQICDGHKCPNGKCIDQTAVCDGKNDCGDRSDEATCPRLGYEVRLSNDKGKKHEGRVEVKVYDVWGYVCDDKFDIKAANVLCKELGFEMGAAELRLGSQYAPSAGLTDGEDTIFIMDEVECKGNETSLKECDFNGWGVHDCNADEIVGVVCKIPIMKCPADYWLCEMSQECIPTGFLCDNVYDCSDHSDESPKQCNASLEIRLVDGASKHEGRVEVKYRGIWGTICDDDFTKEAADVICRQLGFEGESTVVKSKFGQGKGPIWLDQVKCIGNETTIDDCVHWQWGEHNCAHTEDVGVKCFDGTQRIARTQTSKTKGKLQTRFEDFPYAERSSKLLPEQCGRVKVDLKKEQYHERVVQSTKTQRGEIPWQASIRAKKAGISAHWCGAVLISRYHLITAAHCLTGYPKGAYMVRLGDYRSDEVEPSEIEVYVENLYIHEDFRKGQHMNNDIAIVLLKSPIRFNSYIQPVCLPDKKAPYTPGMNCTISGWGAIQSGSMSTSFDLRAGKVPIQPMHICKQPGVYGEAITEGMFCAGSLSKGVDACDGDSGGPLVCESNGVNTLYGIISWGQHCGFVNKPGVYVKVSHYIDWIEQKLEHSKHTFGA